MSNQRVRGTRPVAFQAYLPNIFRIDDAVQLEFVSASGTTISVSTFQTGDYGFPAGTPVVVPSRQARTTLSQGISPNSVQAQILVNDGAFGAGLQKGDALVVASFLTRFLRPLEGLFEQLEASVEGAPQGELEVAVVSESGTTINVVPFQVDGVGFPAGTVVTSGGMRTTLSKAIQANSSVSQLEVKDSVFVQTVNPNDLLVLHAGGVPDLFAPDTTPPPQFTNAPQSQSELDYLSYLASWIALPLRMATAAQGDVGASFARGADWNREFFKKAVKLYPQRSTLPGMDALLRAWTKGDLLETDPPLLLLTDLTRTSNDIDAIYQLAPSDPAKAQKNEVYAQLGLNTVLGEGPSYFFIADLIANPSIPDFRRPVGLDALQLAARLLLDSEKPAHTYYQLRLRGATTQLAPAEPVLQLTVVSGSGNDVKVAPFKTDATGFPLGTPITVVGKPGLGTTLSHPLPPNTPGQTDIQVTEASFVEAIGPGDILGVAIWAQLGETSLLWDKAWVFDSD